MNERQCIWWTIGTITTLIFLPQPLCAQQVNAPTQEIQTADVAYTEQGTNTKGFLAEPRAPGSYPAIILIHEWWGLNSSIQDTAKEFARLGYVALAVDLYNGQSTTEPSRARELAGGVRADMDQAFDNLRDAVAFLRAKDNVAGDRLASIGWCFGGGWSYQMAKNDLGVKASVIYYGRFNPADDLAKMRAEIIGHFAEEDRMISLDSVHEFQAKLKTHGGEHEIYIYPNTTHGFASRPGENPGYVKEAAEKAWERTTRFLEKHL